MPTRTHVVIRSSANDDAVDVESLNATDGLQYDIGHDLIEATMNGGKNVKTLRFSGPTNGNGTNTEVKASAGNKSRNPIARLFRR